MKKTSTEQTPEYYEKMFRARSLSHDLSNAIDRSRMIARYITGSTVLDLCCGGGQLANLIDDRQYLGVDFSPSQLRRARLDCKNPNAKFIEADITQLPDDVGRFDCVVLGEVLEHFDDPGAIARIALEHARMRVIITVPVDMPGKDHVWQSFSKEDLEGILGGEAYVCEKFWCINKWYHWIGVWEATGWQPNLSVCIVCQDEEELLPYTLHCIHQSLPIPRLAEVVIVDGGSQDGTLDVIEEWRDKLPIVLLEHPYDTAGKQKNRGLDLCTGDWVLGLDADMTFTKNLGQLFAKGHFDEHPIWDFRGYFTVKDEFHAFRVKNPGATTRLWRNGYRYERDWHEQLPHPPDRLVCLEVYFFENSHLQTRKALLHRGVRWQPYAEEVRKFGAPHGPPARYLVAECKARRGAKAFPSEIKELIVPRDGLEVLRDVDEWRRKEAEIPLPEKVLSHKANREWLNAHYWEGRGEKIILSRETMRTGKFDECCDPEWQRMWGLPHRGHRSDVLRDAILSIWPDTKSVIDLGCCVGNLLESFSKLGIEIWGVDADRSILFDDIHCVPIEFLEIHDLREPYLPPRKFDVCVCTDTLEHIPQEYVDIAIESMARCSDRFYMNIPSEGGGGGGPCGHINMRPIVEWQRDFERHGFERITDLPELVANWENALVMKWED